MDHGGGDILRLFVSQGSKGHALGGLSAGISEDRVGLAGTRLPIGEQAAMPEDMMVEKVCCFCSVLRVTWT